MIAIPRILIGLVACLVAILADVHVGEKVAKFPLQASFDLTITAHEIDEASDFPPHKRHMKIYYDYVNSRARADISPGYEAEKVYLRRYDSKNEYMVRMAPLNDCKRSYLGEPMPYPLLPATEYVHSEEVIRGKRVDYYLHTDFETRVHMYFEYGTDIPVQLLQEAVTSDDSSIDEAGNAGSGFSTSTPMLTYDFTNVIVGEPDAAHFELMQPYRHEQCDRHVGGFPYLHVFHYFVKF
jgi:hypothetical protein